MELMYVVCGLKVMILDKTVGASLKELGIKKRTIGVIFKTSYRKIPPVIMVRIPGRDGLQSFRPSDLKV